MRVLFVCRAFHNMAGGVEKQATLMMNDLAKRGVDVFLLTWDKKDAKSFFSLSESIKWTKMDIGDPNTKADLKTKLMRVLFIRRYLRKNNLKLAICFQFGAFFTFKTATFFTRTKTISAERNSISRLKYTSEGKRAKFMFNFMRFADYITVQFKDYIKKYPIFLRRKIKAVNNPIRIDVPIQFNPSKKQMKLIGRLEYQKNFGVFINALGVIKEHIEDWNIQIIGNGKDFNHLIKSIQENGLDNNVSIIEPISDLDLLYKDTSTVCMPSLWEGFPNVAAEAMARGIPVVGFKECDGVSDLIRSTGGGVLADGNDNVESLAHMLKKIFEGEVNLEELSKNALKNIVKYDEKNILDQWYDFFKELSNE